MSRNNDTYAASAHRDHLAEHDWGPPPPGSGNVKVCRKCGAKQTGGKKNEACDGLQNETWQPTAHDYDPIR